jgi:hypothetical protein
MLVRKELLSPEWAKRILSWPHSGFNVHSHIFIARVTSHIPDKGQVMVRYSGLYANAHRGKVKKASLSPSALRIVEEELRRLPSKGWAALIRKPHIGLRSAAMIRKVYEVDPMICSKCGGRMKVVAFITEVSVVDRIIEHLKLTFVADRPQPCSPHGFHEGRLRVFLNRLPCRRPRRAGNISTVQICFSRSIFVFSVALDIAERSEVYNQRGQVERIIGWSGNSWGPGKSKFFL